MKNILIIICVIFLSNVCFSQTFERKEIKEILVKCEKHIYNSMPDSANIYINKLETKLPNHPVIPMARALTILWERIPAFDKVSMTKIFGYLDETIALAKKKDPKGQDPEIYFFLVSANALKAEFYVTSKESKSKVVASATEAYSFVRKGFNDIQKYPQFLLTTGLYNFFREAYPEKHPIYNALIWVFRRGDKQLGISQLQKCTQQPFLVKVESLIYLSYIYLKFDYQPKMAQKYMNVLTKTYPNNYYAKAKCLEAYANPQDFSKAPLSFINQLTKHRFPYYQMSGYAFKGYKEQLLNKNNEKAKIYYEKALVLAKFQKNKGEYFRCFCNLRLAEILLKEGKKEEARKKLEFALENADVDYLEKEVKEALSKI